MKKMGTQCRRRLLLTGILALFAVCSIAAVIAAGTAVGENPIDGLNAHRSMVLLEGEGYSLNTHQELQFTEHQRQAAQEKAQQTTAAQNDPTDQTAPEKNLTQRPADNETAGESTDHTMEGSNGVQNAGESGTPGGTTGTGQEGGQQGGQGAGEGTGGDNSGNAGGDSKAPRIVTSLTDDQLVSGSFLNFMVSATDYQGTKISRSNFSVTSNGVKLYSSGGATDNTYLANYKPDNLTDGANIIVITVTDSEGNTAVKTVSVQTDTSGTAEIGGSVTIIVEARTLGLGYLINQTVDFYRGESIPYVIDRALKAAGYTYRHTGTMGYGWYLASIEKAGLTNGYQIPPAIQERLDRDGTTETGHEANRLAEKDFYEWSGWVYLYNNEFLPTGMSNVTLTNGDTITIGFTTCMGNEYNGEWFNGSW